MISSTIHQDADCKSYTCCPLAYLSNPQFRTFSVNNDLRVAERRREFDVEELCRLAAQSVGRSSQDIKTFVKLAEGGFNRTSLINMHDGFEMVSRIPYTITIPKFYAIASEVATVCFLRSLGLPIPEVYDYSPSLELNKLTQDRVHFRFLQVQPHIAEIGTSDKLHKDIFCLRSGSLYYTEDLEKTTGRKGILLNDKRFGVGVDARVRMWYGRRSHLDVDRGPCTPLSAYFFLSY
ncbi:hypothetical protein GG344DRAFT_46066 [Lentinula edodes]|nr:hypothetical protein GG344DRAFT_46066 [Lentinula edodes]